MIILKNCFNNYDEFKNLFGITEHSNGVKSRRNKILLGVLKDRDFRKWWLSFEEKSKNTSFGGIVIRHSPYAIRSMDALKQFAQWFMSAGVVYAWTVGLGNDYYFQIHLADWIFRSSKYKLDELQGICADEDAKSVRYVNEERGGRVFKMKAGKFLQAIIEENAATRALPEQLKRWLGEEFTREWQSYASSHIDTGLTLHVDDDFERIYSSAHCACGFGSCMQGKNLWQYYRDSIRAKAAYLTDADGYVVARCVVYQEAHDEYGNTYRLAERQYAKGESNVLKQILVDRLIAEGHIDGYKRIGVDCHANTAFVANNGKSMDNLHLSIECSLDFDEPLSYQDSFVYYDKEAGVAYNDCAADYDYELDTTDGFIKDMSLVYSDYHNMDLNHDHAVWDEYFEDYIPQGSETAAIYDGRTITVDEEHARDSGDFHWSEHEDAYIHHEECLYVAWRDDYFLTEDTVDDIHGETQYRHDCSWSSYHEGYILDDDAEYSSYYGTYLETDSAVFSNHENDWLPEDEAIHSAITDDYYSSEESLLEGEAAYRNEHALMVIA